MTARPFTAIADQLPHIGVLVPTHRVTAELNLEAFLRVGYVEAQIPDSTNPEYSCARAPVRSAAWEPADRARC